ncbi:coiled-coil domain-containing protein 57 [Drosophila busckii]|uniref:coiled-coil domain-containing protein 57 n=1 Tax=Drosophila busckii TaxID=30019 RepID=UPI00083F1F92|nr:coiled-coil domain-containing protein 57 [Drosophila busckii]
MKPTNFYDTDYYQPKVQLRSEPCADSLKLNSWFNDQVTRNAKLTRLNQRLKQLLTALHSNESLEREQCCFYEQHIMQRVFVQINALGKGKTENFVMPLLQTTGEMGKDLVNIMKRMKLMSQTATKDCCENTSQDLLKLQEQLKQQLEEFEQSINAQIKDFPKCCRDMQERLQQYNVELKSVKTQTANKESELELKLKELQVKQIAQADSIKDIKEKLAERAQSMQTVLQNCEKNCGSQMQTDAVLDAQVAPNAQQCQKFEQQQTELQLKLQTLEAKLKELQKPQSRTEIKVLRSDIDKLQSNMQQLQQETATAKDCCKHIDKMEKNMLEMNLQMQNMNNSYNSHMQLVNADVDSLKQRLNTALEKLNELHAKAANVADSAEYIELKRRVDNLDTKLKDALADLDIAKLELKQVSKKLEDTQANANAQLQKLTATTDAQHLAAKEFKAEARRRFEELQALLKNQVQNNNAAVKLNELHDLLKEIIKDDPPVKKIKLRVDNLTEALVNATSNLLEDQKVVADCLALCNGLDGVDDLKRRVHKLEVVIKKCPINPTPTKAPTTGVGVTTRQEHGKSVDSLIGDRDVLNHNK